MKRVIVKFPVNKAGEIADIIGTYGFVCLLSWTEGDGLFNTSIKAHIAVPNEKAEIAEVKFNGLIQKS